MPGDARLKLHNMKNINTVLSMLYDADGNYRAGFKPEEFYNTILLDTLKYGEENYVHLKYAENVTIKKGFTTVKFRRWAGMTPTLRPMLEGVPSAPDKHAYELLEIGNVWSFGRWSEYTDKIDQSVVSDLVSERAQQYGELANQIKELYARKVWLSSPNEYFANFKHGFAELAFGDAITLDDLRFLSARMKRMQVKPISGKFQYICSPEFIHGLIDDPRVKMYMEIEQTTGKLYGSGEPFDLFELQFIPTMLDEFAYPDTEFPGVFEIADGTEVIRLYAIQEGTGGSATVYYLDVHQDFKAGPKKDGAFTTAKYNTGIKYLPDGTAVDDGVIRWELAMGAEVLTLSADNTASAFSEATVKTKIIARKAEKTVTKNTDGSLNISYGALSALGTSDYSVVTNLLKEGLFTQLPVHRGILFGDEALVKLSVEGISDAPRIIIKSVGSSGVMDPLDQRQSVGFRVDGFGLAIKRPEALCVTYGIPANAELAALTAAAIHGDYVTMTNYGLGEDASVDTKANKIVHTETDTYQELHVDGVNDRRIFLEFNASKNYSQGTIVKYNDEYYVFTAGHKGAWTGEDVAKIKLTNETPAVGASNDKGSNIK
jgi:hypothetical protein